MIEATAKKNQLRFCRLLFNGTFCLFMSLVVDISSMFVYIMFKHELRLNIFQCDYLQITYHESVHYDGV